MDVVIPTEIGMPTTWTIVQDQRDKCQELERHLDWADEVRGSAAIRMASDQQRATAYYNRKAQPRAFKVGTLVFRKLQANWEGPYIVLKAGESGVYHLQKLEGMPLFYLWNVSNLRQYYQ